MTKCAGLSYPTNFFKSRGSVVRKKFLEYRAKQATHFSRRNAFYALFATNKAKYILNIQKGCYVSDSTEKAYLLNEYFVQQTSLDERSTTIPAMMNIIGPTLTNVNFTLLEVISVLESLQLGKSSGPDGINNRILKELSSPLSRPLSYLFNYAMPKGIFPDIWKEANVSPLFKKDDPSSVSNYRPISLLNTIGKVMEKMFTNICLTSF